MAEMDAAAYLKRGVEFFNKEDFDRAISDFREAYRRDQNNADAKSNLIAAYFNRGMAHFQKGNIDLAITDLTEAIRLNPEDASNYGARGYIYGQKGERDGVIRDFTEVIRLDKNDAAAYGGRAAAYNEKCREALSKNNENGFFYYLDLSIEDYESILKIEPGNTMAQKAFEAATKEWEL